LTVIPAILKYNCSGGLGLGGGMSPMVLMPMIPAKQNTGVLNQSLGWYWEN